MNVERDQLIISAAIMRFTLNHRNYMISGQLASSKDKNEYYNAEDFVVILNDKEYFVSITIFPSQSEEMYVFLYLRRLYDSPNSFT